MFQLETICWMCPLFVSPLTLCLLIISWQPLVGCSLRVLRFERRNTRSSNEISAGKVDGILAEDISEKSERVAGNYASDGRIMNIPIRIRVIIKRVICVECWLSAPLPIVDPEKHGRMLGLPLLSLRIRRWRDRICDRTNADEFIGEELYKKATKSGEQMVNG